MFRIFLTFLLAVGPLLGTGCAPESIADDDSAVGDDDSSATGDDDDDATTGLNGGGTTDVTGAPACTPIGSALIIDNVEGYTQLTGIHAKTANIGCARYNAWDDSVAAAFDVYNPAYDAAVAVRDPVAGCEAVTVLYQSLQAIQDEITPPGSCQLELRPDQILPGDYEVGEGLGEGMYGQVIYHTASYYGAALTSLGVCTQYNEWDGVWTLAQAEAAEAAEATRDVWQITAGTMNLTVTEDQWGADALDMELTQQSGGGTATLFFQLELEECQI